MTAKIKPDPYLKKLLASLPNREERQGKFKRGYVGWGPHEDYMIVKGDGWNSVLYYASSAELLSKFANGSDIDFNLVADFYFGVSYDSQKCDSCGETGYNPETRKIADSFYEHSCPPGMKAWNDDITQDECGGCGKTAAQPTNRAGWCNACWPWAPAK